MAHVIYAGKRSMTATMVVDIAVIVDIAGIGIVVVSRCRQQGRAEEEEEEKLIIMVVVVPVLTAAAAVVAVAVMLVTVVVCAEHDVLVPSLV